MLNDDVILLTLGALLLLGLATDALGRLTRLPRVTILVLFGVLIGPSGLDLLPVAIEAWYRLFADVALLMVGFLLGGKLSLASLRRTGRPVLWISAFEVLGVAAAMFLGLTALGFDFHLALLLAGIAPASAPAAISAVVDEARAKGRYTDILLGVVALDDAWGLIVFSVLLAAAQALQGGGGVLESLQYGAWELGGALLVGVVLGLPAAYLTGRIEPGEPTQTEALGVVFLCGGLALYLEVSFLLAAMLVGAIVVNLAQHHNRPFREIRHIEWPFMVLFFVLAGASLHLDEILEIGAVGAAYIGLRVAGLVAGAWLGGLLGKAEALHRRWIGLAITPQAGVALGMALVASSRFPELGDRILAIVIGTTVVFELAGPVLTRLALLRVGEGRT
ncbi:MAG TPA: cation:proton antiporter [Kiloniellales bacterium]|nr:cation:proton antiporter [Kiloniellales bacterium]